MRSMGLREGQEEACLCGYGSGRLWARHEDFEGRGLGALKPLQIRICVWRAARCVLCVLCVVYEGASLALRRLLLAARGSSRDKEVDGGSAGARSSRLAAKLALGWCQVCEELGGRAWASLCAGSRHSRWKGLIVVRSFWLCCFGKVEVARRTTPGLSLSHA